jgi:hypothetical protein
VFPAVDDEVLELHEGVQLRDQRNPGESPGDINGHPVDIFPIYD